MKHSWWLVGICSHPRLSRPLLPGGQTPSTPTLFRFSSSDQNAFESYFYFLSLWSTALNPVSLYLLNLHVNILVLKSKYIRVKFLFIPIRIITNESDLSKQGPKSLYTTRLKKYHLSYLVDNVSSDIFSFLFTIVYSVRLWW